ncbi:YceD family protein [Methylopila musalis]|uniref:YceD family protein n=1 Tax=Methylopila musalis TaxID=1134781 RepID=A0ABW3Z319_9HYPH
MTETDSPFSRPLVVATVPPEGVDVDIVADAVERAALAALNDAPEIERLEARLHARPFGVAGIEVTGRISAEVVRICVVSLEPFPTEVDETISVRFVPAEALPQGQPGEEIELPENDLPDPYVNGVIDLGAVVSEFLTLGLDPYPRKPGAALPADAGDREGGSPFAALSRLKAADSDDSSA